MTTFRWMLGSLIAVGSIALGSSMANAEVTVDPKIPAYKTVDGVSGTIKSIGSDTLNEVMTLWAEGFKKAYPNVTIESEAKGSATAPPALLQGTSNFGPMSREMKADELKAFDAKFGYKPTALKTSIDMLAVYTSKDNPIKGLTLQQVDAIFSSTRKGGLKEDIDTWGKAGLTGDWASQPISLYGRNSASGTYGYFKDHALFKGDYKSSVKEQPGSSAVVNGVANDKFAIGYSGIGYKTADVNAVPLAPKDGKPFVTATLENAYNGEYPLSRYLLVYVNAKPGEPLDPLRLEFIKFIFSKEGQEAVIKGGYYPVTSDIATKALNSVGVK